MKFSNPLRICLTVSAFLLSSVIASPVAAELTGLDRYVPGSVGAVVSGMHITDDGVFSLGSDGVLRAFAADRQVVDYRQLDPEQFKELASMQVSGWEHLGGAESVPASVLNLAQSSVDGRIVTNVEQLMNPKEKPSTAAGGQPTTTNKSRRAPEQLFSRAGPRVCPGSPGCSSLHDCQQHHCNACFFPHGPPHGTCFL
ncbi:hypothetical protein HIM_05796 [Hirsutella minnesotensis 3608]|uniref:Uncharacterized protein n=1 Tax=Hirsutella minnesotensis 3608 TaxID=1043627 RepID=A0A0F7ZZY3_9HYPO|nr:hypothetical protein HIM_05796 [Hirsutella minnesotensis 3608]